MPHHSRFSGDFYKRHLYACTPLAFTCLNVVCGTALLTHASADSASYLCMLVSPQTLRINSADARAAPADIPIKGGRTLACFLQLGWIAHVRCVAPRREYGRTWLVVTDYSTCALTLRGRLNRTSPAIAHRHLLNDGNALARHRLHSAGGCSLDCLAHAPTWPPCLSL